MPEACFELIKGARKPTCFTCFQHHKLYPHASNTTEAAWKIQHCCTCYSFWPHVLGRGKIEETDSDRQWSTPCINKGEEDTLGQSPVFPLQQAARSDRSWPLVQEAQQLTPARGSLFPPRGMQHLLVKVGLQGGHQTAGRMRL